MIVMGRHVQQVVSADNGRRRIEGGNVGNELRRSWGFPQVKPESGIKVVESPTEAARERWRREGRVRLQDDGGRMREKVSKEDREREGEQPLRTSSSDCNSTRRNLTGLAAD